MALAPRTYYLSRNGKRILACLIGLCLLTSAIDAWSLTQPDAPTADQQAAPDWQPRSYAERTRSFVVQSSVRGCCVVLLLTGFLPRARIDARGIGFRKWFRWTFCSWDALRAAYVARMHFGENLPYAELEQLAPIEDRTLWLAAADYDDIAAALTPAGTHTHLTPLPEHFRLPDFADGNDAEIDAQGLVWKLHDAPPRLVEWPELTSVAVEWDRSPDGLCFLRFEFPQIPRGEFSSFAFSAEDIECEPVCPDCDRTALLLRFLHRYLRPEQIECTQH